MKAKELTFKYPEELIATEPRRPSRVMWSEADQFKEMTTKDLIEKIPAGDVFVINETKVLKRRVFTDAFEIVFVKELAMNQWEVLLQASKLEVGDIIDLPLGKKIKLLSKGRPQVVEVSEKLDEKYFDRVGELALPPYIQKARQIRRPLEKDLTWYQTEWAQKPGSLAAPTASLHFSDKDIQRLQDRGVVVVKVTLHVGLGTFLPILTEHVEDHPIHEEFVEVPAQTWAEIMYACEVGRGVWAVGTTVARALESVASGNIKEDDRGNFSGLTHLFITPGFRWNVVNRLLTNFHQPESTLLAMVIAFAGADRVFAGYAWAIERKFRLFSYGDLTVWMRP